MQTRDREKERRDSVLLMLLILLFGFGCIILSSGWALRFAPSWRLNSSMGSNLNPDSDFLTNVPVGLFEPLDPSILTNPAWMDVFLTPGASFSTPIPVSTSTNSPTATNIVVTTVTNAPADTLVPTNTLIFFPTPSVTPKPPTSKSPTFTPTNTPVPASSADLQVTKTDGVTTYTPGGTLTYTVTIANNGPTNVVGAFVTDGIPGKIASWSWACTSQTGGATGCNAVAGSTTNFTDTVNLPNGASIVYTVTANVSAGATGNLTNTATINVPAGYTDPTPGNNSATDTDTQIGSADLQITKTDGVATYTAGGTLSYTITVTNNGTGNVTGATVTDNIPAQVATWAWACTSQTGGATGCTPAGSSSANFSDVVNLPVGGSIVYTVTANISAGAAGNLTNTASVAVPAGFTDPVPGNNAASDTDTPVFTGDLSLSKTDNATEYAPNISIQYTIVASNLPGPSNVTGATVTDTFSANLTGVTWTCAGSGGASCTGAGAGDINDTVNLPVGSSVQYTVNATVIGAPAGNLNNTATITAPAGVTDSNPGNNSATDVDTLIIPDVTPGEIGTGPDGVVYVVPSGTYLTLQFGTPLVVGGHAGWDLVYYELPQGTNPGVMMDVVILQIGDGQNWYTILNWGNGAADTNTNISIPLAVPPNPTDCVGEPDNCEIDASLLFNNTGVSIELDGFVPPGTYPYIRIFAPPAPPDTDGGAEVDGIEILP